MTAKSLAKRLHAGLRFIIETTAKPRVFAQHGSDLLFCLHHLAATSPASAFRTEALRSARMVAGHWRARFHDVPEDAGADAVTDLVIGHDTAKRLGFPAPDFHLKLEEAARELRAEDFFCSIPHANPLRPRSATARIACLKFVAK
jgi:hypothetical protein